PTCFAASAAATIVSARADAAARTSPRAKTSARMIRLRISANHSKRAQRGLRPLLGGAIFPARFVSHGLPCYAQRAFRRLQHARRPEPSPHPALLQGGRARRPRSVGGRDRRAPARCLAGAR